MAVDKVDDFKDDWFRVRSVLAIVLAMGTASTCVAQDIAYENHNQIDYGPLHLSQIAGLAKDENGFPVSQVTLGLFTDKEHALVAVARTDRDGKFSFKQVAAGHYRLVAKNEAFCTANVPIIMKRTKGSSSLLVLHMIVGGIDKCSWGSVRTELSR